MPPTIRAKLFRVALVVALLVIVLEISPSQREVSAGRKVTVDSIVYLPDDIAGTNGLTPILLTNGIARRLDTRPIAASKVSGLPAENTSTTQLRNASTQTAAVQRVISSRVQPQRVAGDRTALVVLVRTPTIANSVSGDRVSSVMRDVISNLSSASRGALRLSYSTTEITIDSVGCEFTANQNAVKAALAGRTADHLIVVVPTVCEWAGLGYVGAGELEITMGQFTAMGVLHELGHNFGLYHAGTATCSSDGKPVEFSIHLTDCTISEYGDPDSYMGFGEHALSVSQLVTLGWLEAGQIAQDPSGEVQLSESSSAVGFIGIRVSAPQGGSYWFEFRTGGVDGREVQVRYSPELETRSTSDRVDTILLKPSASARAYGLTAAGDTWSDPSGTALVSLIAIDGTGARLSVARYMEGFVPLPEISFTADSKRITYSLECTPSVQLGIHLVISKKGKIVLDKVLRKCQGNIAFVHNGMFRYTLTSADSNQAGVVRSGTFVSAARTVQVQPIQTGLRFKITNTKSGERFTAVLHASDGSITTVGLNRTTRVLNLDPAMSYVVEVSALDRRGRALLVAVPVGISFTPLR